MPHGAFYTFPNVGSFGRTSTEIADHLLYDAGVCGLAGTAFGAHGEGYLRFSYANSRENLAGALERMASRWRSSSAPASSSGPARDGSAARPRHPGHPGRGPRPGPRGVRGRPLGGRAAAAA